MNKQVFVFDSLMKADYVIIFCSPAFKVAEDHKVAKQPQPSGKIDISFNTSKRLISNLLSLYKGKICFLICYFVTLLKRVAVGLPKNTRKGNVKKSCYFFQKSSCFY